MPGRASRNKGARFERLIVDLLRSYALDAYRIPLSGASRGFKSDVELRLGSQKLTLEAKSRKSGFTFLYRALGDNDALCVKVDRDDPLIVMPLRRFACLMSELKAGEPA